MPKHGISQEQLKLIACVSMLIDHIGVFFVLNAYNQASGAAKAELFEIYKMLHTIGRLAFPIYCFLLVEGVFHTGNSTKYGIRLLIGALLSEIPFDLVCYGRINIEEQSVMVTILLGFVMLLAFKKSSNLLLKLLIVAPFAMLAEQLHGNYGYPGILTIAAFALTRDLQHKFIWQAFLLWFIFSPNHQMLLNWLGGSGCTIQELCMFSLLPISLYDGRKATKSKLTQWAFYLFYPVHLS